MAETIQEQRPPIPAPGADHEWDGLRPNAMRAAVDATDATGISTSMIGPRPAYWWLTPRGMHVTTKTAKPRGGYLIRVFGVKRGDCSIDREDMEAALWAALCARRADRGA